MKKKNVVKKREVYAEERRILRKAMLEKKLVVFVGAGASIESGMPCWRDAITKIAEKLNIPNSNIDYMKIPQFYYNARGNKEYVELVRDIFKYNIDLPINDIQRNIIKLNTHTIITTNYDCLLEKAAEENAEFIQVVSQDRDLPYRTAGKEIIKIHGDLKNNNFVLKEDDYLHYSKEFKLIEAYTKSLFATNVVLFVGYSFSDPDVAQIFSWVKNILAEDFQRAYMLEVKKQYDVYEHDYYKNLGVNIIYASEMHEDFDKNKAFDYTNEFLEYILEEDYCENKIDDIYIQCQAYKNLNYIARDYLNRIFNKYFIIVEGRMLYARDNKVGNELLAEIFISKADEDNLKIELIKSIVNKSIIETVEISNGKQTPKRIKIGGDINCKIEEAIKEFDYDKLRCIKEENEADLSNNKPGLYLEQAYISYVLFEYDKAYRYLRISSQLFYKKNQIVWYFISEVNRKNLGRIIQSDLWGNYNVLEKKKINNEVESLDIETVYHKIPTKEIPNKEFLQDLYTFSTYYRFFQNTYMQSKKTETEAKTNYSFYAAKPGYQKLRDQIIDYYHYDLYNYIMVDKYAEDIESYRLFAKTIINSACSCAWTENEGRQKGKLSSSNVYVKELEKFDIYIIIRYMESKELKIILQGSKKRYIKLNDEAKKYLQRIILNLSKINTSKANYFSNFLILVGYIELDESIVRNTLEAISTHLDSFFVRINFNEINRFLWWANEQELYSTSDNSALLGNLIDKFIQKILETDMGMDYKQLVLHCLIIYDKMEKHYDSEQINLLAKSEEYDILAEIYPYVIEHEKKQIKAAFNKWKSNIAQFRIYGNAVINNIISCDENIEKEILSSLEETRRNSQHIEPDNYEDVIGIITNLYLTDNVIMKEEMRSKVLESNIALYEWLIDVNNYDYNTFDVSWLKMCNDKLLEKMASIPEVKEGITRKIKDTYISTSVDSEVLKKYFKFFVKND